MTQKSNKTFAFFLNIFQFLIVFMISNKLQFACVICKEEKKKCQKVFSWLEVLLFLLIFLFIYFLCSLIFLIRHFCSIVQAKIDN